MIRPSNAAGPSPEGLRAIPRQEMRSPPAKAKRSTYRPSPRYRPKPAPDPVKKPVTKRGKRRGKKPTGKMRDRLPGESGGAYATRKFLSAAERAMDPVARTKREYPGIKTPEAKARTPGQPAYKVRAKSDYEKYTKPSADAARKETNFALIPGTPQYKSRFGGKGPTSEADRKQVAYAIRKAKRKPGYTLPSAAQSWEGPDLISKERKQSERGLAASRKALSRMRPSE